MNAAIRRVLYVEDDPDIRALAIMSMEEVGSFTVIACASGEEALERGPGAEPDVIVLDMMMPGMDGHATLRALRAIPALVATPAIFMTTRVQPAEVAAHLAVGAIGVIPKPFDPMTLPDEIRRLCAGG